MFRSVKFCASYFCLFQIRVWSKPPDKSFVSTINRPVMWTMLNMSTFSQRSRCVEWTVSLFWFREIFTGDKVWQLAPLRPHHIQSRDRKRVSSTSTSYDIWRSNQVQTLFTLKETLQRGLSSGYNKMCVWYAHWFDLFSGMARVWQSREEGWTSTSARMRKRSRNFTYDATQTPIHLPVIHVCRRAGGRGWKLKLLLSVSLFLSWSLVEPVSRAVNSQRSPRF